MVGGSRTMANRSKNQSGPSYLFTRNGGLCGIMPGVPPDDFRHWDTRRYVRQPNEACLPNQWFEVDDDYEYWGTVGKRD